MKTILMVSILPEPRKRLDLEERLVPPGSKEAPGERDRLLSAMPGARSLNLSLQ